MQSGSMRLNSCAFPTLLCVAHRKFQPVTLCLDYGFLCSRFHILSQLSTSTMDPNPVFLNPGHSYLAWEWSISYSLWSECCEFLILVCCLFCFVFSDRVWLYRPGWPGTHRDPPTSASQVLGLKVYTSSPSVFTAWQFNLFKKLVLAFLCFSIAFVHPILSFWFGPCGLRSLLWTGTTLLPNWLST
jgi:hypothetical protein